VVLCHAASIVVQELKQVFLEDFDRHRMYPGAGSLMPFGEIGLEKMQKYRLNLTGGVC